MGRGLLGQWLDSLASKKERGPFRFLVLVFCCLALRAHGRAKTLCWVLKCWPELQMSSLGAPNGAAHRPIGLDPGT